MATDAGAGSTSGTIATGGIGNNDGGASGINSVARVRETEDIEYPGFQTV